MTLLLIGGGGSSPVAAIQGGSPMNRILDLYGRPLDGGEPLVRPRYSRRALNLIARSSHLLNAAYATQPDIPGMVQPFPTTAAGLIAAIPGTAATAANVKGIYACDTASPFVDSLGLASNLNSVGAPLLQRECVGLPTTSFVGKLGGEFVAAAGNAMAEPGASSFTVPDGEVRSFIAVARFPFNAVVGPVLGKEVVNGWFLYTTPATPSLNLYVSTYATSAQVSGAWFNGAWHCLVGVIDGRVAGSHVLRLYTDLGDGLSATFATSLAAAAPFYLGGSVAAGSGGSEFAYFAWLDVALTTDDRAAFWRPYSTAAFQTPSTYTRTTPLRCAITASRVAAYGAGQVAIGFDAGAVDAAGGNALGTGVVIEGGARFAPIGASAQYANSAVGFATKTLVTGASGLLDGVRISMAAAWAAASTGSYMPSAGNIISGVTNVPWVVAARVRRGTSGTTARMGLFFVGDPGGAELFNIVATSDAVTADWMLLYGTVTPTRAAHTTCYVCYGSAANGENADWSDIYLVQNRNTPIASWRLDSSVTVYSTTNTPIWSVANTDNRRYSPIRGAESFGVCGFPGVATPVQVSGSPFATGGAPYASCADSAGHIWTANFAANNLTVYNARTRALVSTFASGGNGPYAVACDGLNQVWVANFTSSTISIYNATTLALITTIAGPASVHGLAADGNGRMWSVGTVGGVKVFNAATYASITTFASGGAAPSQVCIDYMDQAWIQNYNGNSVSVYNATTFALIGTYSVGANPYGICADRMNQVWSSSGPAGSITVFNAATKAVVRTITGQLYPYYCAADAYGRVMVSNASGGATYFTMFDAATGTVVGRPTVGTVNGGVVVDSYGQVWISAAGLHCYQFGPTFLGFGNHYTAGSLVLDYAGDVSFTPLAISAARLRLRVWDGAAALVATISGGALDANRHKIEVQWDSRTPLRTGVAGQYLAVLVDGVVTGSGGAPWTPRTTDVTPIFVGTDAAGANPCCCLIY